jgi:23S rRNA pseudouridine1911/1915/1917 synthase
MGIDDGDLERPGIVHRLDKDTSGVLLLAKNPEAKAYLQKLFKERLISKTYVALVSGRLKDPEATIKLPIGRNPRVPTKRTVIPGARAAVTHYRVVKEFPGASLLEIDLQTGRTHQIRVHFSHLGHPVVGDVMYGAKPAQGMDRQFLHASQVKFELPDGQEVIIHSPLPADLAGYLEKLEREL